MRLNDRMRILMDAMRDAHVPRMRRERVVLERDTNERIRALEVKVYAERASKAELKQAMQVM